jgi:hypothetical protein
MRDFQRTRVYRFDSLAKKLIGGKLMELDECHALIERVLSDHDVPMVKVTPGNGRRSGCWSPHSKTIKLPRSVRHVEYVLHEAAHALEDLAWPGDDRSAHGPEFVNILLYLLARYAKLNLRWAKAKVWKLKIKWDDDMLDELFVHPHVALL